MESWPVRRSAGYINIYADRRAASDNITAIPTHQKANIIDMGRRTTLNIIYWLQVAFYLVHACIETLTQ